MATSQPLPFACPQCQQLDRVEKVSSLVESGTSHGVAVGTGRTNRGGFMGIGGERFRTVQHSVHQTALSQRLSPPTLPRYISPWLWIGLAVLLGFYVISIVISAGGVTAIIGSLVVIGVVAAIIYFIVRKMPQMKAKRAAQQAQWNYARQTWDKLYYCNRCGGVFLPGGQSPLIPTEQMMAFINSAPMGYAPTP